MSKIEENKGKCSHCKVLDGSILHLWDHTIIGLIVMHGPSNLTLMPNIKIIEFAYS